MENSLSDEELLFLSNLMHIKKEGQFKNIWNKKNVDNKSSIDCFHVNWFKDL